MKVLFKKVGIDAVLEDLTIEVNSIEEAKDKLYRMSLQELIDNINVLGDCGVKDADPNDYKIVQATAIVNVIDISFSEDDVEDATEHSITLPDHLDNLVLEDTGTDSSSDIVEDDDVADAIQNAIYDKYHRWYYPESFDFDVKKLK